MSRIKVFLGAFVNYTNAQNLNCLALARYLDKSKYDVMTGIGYSGNLPTETIPGVKYLKMRYPARIWRPLCLVYGILWCDIVYLPTPMHWKMCNILIKLLHKKAFKTVEIMMTEASVTRITKSTEIELTIEDIRKELSYTGHTYSITRAMRDVNEQRIGLKSEDHILYLGTEYQKFYNDIPRKALTDIAIIGSNLFYKGIEDFFRIVSVFPNLNFHVIGSGMGKIDFPQEIEKRNLKNLKWHGPESHEQLKKSLGNIQLHVFPSRADGFPKVTLETAAAGVPSVVYDDYGANEWITSGKNGFVVKSVDDMITVIQDLLDHPEKLQPLADNARELAKSFDWKVRIKDWEKIIDTL